MNQNGNRPKVELALNKEVKLTLTKDRCYEGTNSFGTYYLYSVEQDGEPKSFFATPDVHQQILENGLKSGDQFQIKKLAVQNGRKVASKTGFEVVKKSETPPTSLPANGNGRDDGFKELMRRCVSDAVDIVKEVNTISWQNEDARALAITLFLQRVRS